MRLWRECLKLDMKILIPSDGSEGWQGLPGISHERASIGAQAAVISNSAGAGGRHERRRPRAPSQPAPGGASRLVRAPARPRDTAVYPARGCPAPIGPVTAADLFRRVVGVLDGLGIPYMLTDSFASSYQIRNGWRLSERQGVTWAWVMERALPDPVSYRAGECVFQGESAAAEPGLDRLPQRGGPKELRFVLVC